MIFTISFLLGTRNHAAGVKLLPSPTEQQKGTCRGERTRLRQHHPKEKGVSLPNPASNSINSFAAKNLQIGLLSQWRKWRPFPCLWLAYQQNWQVLRDRFSSKSEIATELQLWTCPCWWDGCLPVLSDSPLPGSCAFPPGAGSCQDLAPLPALSAHLGATAALQLSVLCASSSWSGSDAPGIPWLFWWILLQQRCSSSLYKKQVQFWLSVLAVHPASLKQIPPPE